jgi:hypothetical protein
VGVQAEIKWSPLTVEDDAERDRASFLHSPKKSTGTVAKELSMSKTTVSRVVPRDFADLKARIIATVKNIDAPLLTRLWKELQYRIDVCRVTCGAHIEHLYLSKSSFSVFL